MTFQLDLSILNLYTDETSLWNMKMSQILEQSGTLTQIMGFACTSMQNGSAGKIQLWKASLFWHNLLSTYYDITTSMNDKCCIIWMITWAQLRLNCIHMSVSVFLFHNLKINWRVHFLGNTSYYLKKHQPLFFSMLCCYNYKVIHGTFIMYKRNTSFET
jgi:hypothetical protein